MDVDEVVTAVARAVPDVLVALDFDGTLAPLVVDPEDSRPVHGTIEVLSELARRGVRIAVVTGRDARTVMRLGGFADVPGILVAGLYGVETWTDGALQTPDTPEPMARLAEQLPRTLRAAGADPNVWIEDKRLSFVVHGRRAADPDAALAPLREPVGALANELGLEVHPGNGVLELRLPGYDKAGALRRLVEQGTSRAVLFAGDDLGDVPAFAEIRRLRAEGRAAYGIAVESSGVAPAVEAADVSVATAAELISVLRRL